MPSLKNSNRCVISILLSLSISKSSSYVKLTFVAKQKLFLCYSLQRMIFPRSLEVWKLGKVNYLEALKLQEKLVCDRKAHKIPDTLLSLQHPPTYTLGKRRTDHNLLIPVPELEKIGAELHYTQRGGDITYHGPHQAILYPIISLRDIGLGARKYVEKLELTMIDMASQYGVKACAGKKCETGVWVGDRKIGAIGVRISSGITSHGLAFNVDPDLDYFKHIVPCGIADKEVTSLRRETGNIGYKAFENSGPVVIMLGELSRSNLNTVRSRISIFNQ
ncbi:octanoyltransferase LIP2, mitochondrial-like isoform X3 [Populus nigra]|uniref:octanoyltransferase LIP2, mitochondrial-like isoform X3 n=1 Tax=Populus nigra TaxID=3691 RepID=UPI002B272135|nr:octanoyltransferase LIP2, mitochondrial-like isoform X3 [Populus nigra]